jgi:hypothetical protein
VNKSFTTKPKTRKRGHFISGDRCRAFMLHLWDVGLHKKARPKTLEYEFVQCFETNDSRIITKYIGRTKEVVRSRRDMVRINRSSGDVANFNYQYSTHITQKTGLLEQLDYITFSKDDGYFKLNHERMPYYTEQSELNLPPQPPSEEVNEYANCEGSSIDDLRVCSVETRGRNEHHAGDDAEASCDSVEREKEEEVIGCAHTNPYLDPNMNRKVYDTILLSERVDPG